MSLELPNEIWTDILKRVRRVRDWSRLQQVSRAFNAIIRDQCWTQAKQLSLQIEDEKGRFCLEVNGKGRMQLSGAKLVLLVKELANKATKIQKVSLNIFEKTLLPEDDGGMALQLLASASLEVKQLDLHRYAYWVLHAAVPLANFINSISGSLETLSIDTGPITSPDLHRAFRNCRALKNIDIGSVPRRDTVESLLHGKSELEMVGMKRCMGPPIQASDLLSTGAHLTACHFGPADGSFIWDEYLRAVQVHNLIANHPLKTLKTLTLTLDPPGVLPTLQLFPDLEELNLLELPFHISILNPVIGHFLREYGDTPGNRRFLNIGMTGYVPFPLAELVQLMLCPVASAEEKEWWNWDLTFLRWNATVKATILKECRSFGLT